ncbi:hypothetical protein J2T57_002604 [Natronocella acetinitrilica]|uniref:Phage tail protein n=1 Tax=Natronocella acetinitrilica TaxID=414046 RepID=A0AAE3KC77_9GAMM|nr:gpW family protein [Natronocella acetinitrilica]MCP1675454.1 hypothetical protein [Natronocella acetinitrilica]
MDASALAKLPMETLESRLTEAHEALHRLAVGDREVQVSWRDGRRSQWSEITPEYLNRYIAALDSAITAKRTRRPARAPVYLEF